MWNFIICSGFYSRCGLCYFVCYSHINLPDAEWFQFFVVSFCSADYCHLNADWQYYRTQVTGSAVKSYSHNGFDFFNILGLAVGNRWNANLRTLNCCHQYYPETGCTK